MAFNVIYVNSARLPQPLQPNRIEWELLRTNSGQLQARQVDQNALSWVSRAVPSVLSFLRG
jgi:hypothetical protein